MYFFITGYIRRRISTSPRAWYSAQGTSTHASPHQATAIRGMVVGKPKPCAGTVLGMPPVGSCSASTSSSHLSKNRPMSKLKQAVGANTAMSPVQPMRSSRWGQSVGMSTRLDLALQVILLWSWLTISLEQAKLPVCSRSE